LQVVFLVTNLTFSPDRVNVKMDEGGIKQPEIGKDHEPPDHIKHQIDQIISPAADRIRDRQKNAEGFLEADIFICRGYDDDRGTLVPPPPRSGMEFAPKGQSNPNEIHSISLLPGTGRLLEKKQLR
jgi:hypothetical protein